MLSHFRGSGSYFTIGLIGTSGNFKYAVLNNV
jgi:hypothetical protein